MADCYLTDRQKELLRSVVPGLRDGTVETEWIIHKDRGVIMGIRGIPPGDLWDSTWQGEVKQADIDDFVNCGFLRQQSDNRYTLAVGRITDAVDNNFSEDGRVQQQNSMMDGTMIVKPTFGLPSKSTQFDCDVFMIMPFSPEFQSIYDDHINPVVVSLGLIFKRGDDFFSDQAIMNDIWSATNQCKLVIADCTGKNPNVFYELGIAHTLGKPAIMITQDMNDIPFDLRHLRVIQYEYTPRGMKELEQQLIKAVRSLLQDFLSGPDGF